MRKHVLEEQRIDSFEEWLQFAVGSTYDLDTILANLMTDQIAEEVRLYAIAVAKEVLKNASENAKFVVDGDEEDYCISFSSCGEYSSSITISKQSILSETNIPELK